MKRSIATPIVLLLLAFALLAGCNRSTSAEETQDVGTSGSEMSETTGSAEPAATTQLRVYLVRDEVVAPSIREVPETTAVAKAAVEQLLTGPNASENDMDMSSAIPAGTKVLGVTIADGVATVDLSSEFESGGGSLSMQLRAAQVVYTLTQFPTVDSVAFEIDGNPLRTLGGEGLELSPPVGRADFENVTPAIFVENPAPGASVSSPLRLTGTANVFESLFVVTVTAPNGDVVTEQAIQATSGFGSRDTFDQPIEFDVGESGAGTITVYQPSEDDGSPLTPIEIPVTFIVP